MPTTPSPVSLEHLQRQVARLRRLVLLLALPWLAVAVAALAPDVPDQLTTRRLVVVDEAGVERMVLQAPTIPARPGPHAPPLNRSTPELSMTYEDGHAICIGGYEPQLRIEHGDWRSGLRSTGLFAAYESDRAEVAALLTPFEVTLSGSWNGDETFHWIGLDVGDPDAPPTLMVTEGERDWLLPQR